MISAKHYQKEAVNNALDIFRHAESQLQAAQDADSRRTASAANGCVLLEAPTGAGKTLMAGLIAEAFARFDHQHNAKIVWFWFTPFANLVEQAKSSLKEDFVGLRVRDLGNERIGYTTKSGDVFVTTWQSVAARNADSRRLRKSGDLSLSLDQFLVELRQADFRVGVVVDEAHHGFGHDTEAMRFYRDIMQPNFTLLITATPDDADIETFRKAAGWASCTVSGFRARLPWMLALSRLGCAPSPTLPPTSKKPWPIFPARHWPKAGRPIKPSSSNWLTSG